MSEWLPNWSGRQWAVQVVLMAALASSIYGYATASSEARLLATQLAESQEETEALTDTLVIERAESDVLIAAQEENVERTDSIITVATEEVAVAVQGTDAAVAVAREAAADLPIVQAALDAVTQELADEREAGELFRATSAAEIFAGQQRERTLGMQLLNERTASDGVIAGLRSSLSISMQESDAWERAAKPGALTQVWKQGRAAAVAVIVILTVK